MPTRHRLSQLGHDAPSSSASPDNLLYLIDRLSTDLDTYKALADYWKRKYMEIESTEKEGNESGIANGGPNSSREANFVAKSPGSSSDDDISLDTRIIRKLNSYANPSLSFLELGEMKVYSDVSSLMRKSTFQVVMYAMNSAAALHQVADDSDNPLANIYNMMPEFSPHKAQRIWDDIFNAPMSFYPSQASFTASPSCRRAVGYEHDNMEADHYDKVMAQYTNLEVIEALHYLSLLISGMHQAVFDDPSLAPARIHMGKACERLLREMVFARSLTQPSNLSMAVFYGLFGSVNHFCPLEMVGAVSSILELSWSILNAITPPLSLLPKASSSTAFNHANTAYYGIPRDSSSTGNAQSEACFTLSQNATTFMSATSPSDFAMANAMLCFMALVLAPNENKRIGWARKMESLLEMSQEIRCFHAIFWCYFGKAYYALLTLNQDDVLHNVAVMEELLQENPLNRGMNESWDSPPLMSSPHPISMLDESRILLDLNTTDDYNLLFLDEASKIGNLFGDELPLPEPSYAVADDHISEIDSSTIDTSNMYLNEHGQPFVPGENLKAIYRISVQLLRAETALIFQDQQTCMSWVDEAERTLQSITLNYMFQKVFLAKNVIKRTCPFPNGTRSVVDEFELRMLAHDRAEAHHPGAGRVSMGALWRTP